MAESITLRSILDIELTLLCSNFDSDELDISRLLKSKINFQSSIKFYDGATYS